jgi:hypothetical protein
MKTSITFYLNTSKKSKRTGNVPLYARVYFNGLKAEERLSTDTDETEVLKWDPMSMRFTNRQSLANKLLSTLDQKFQDFISLKSTSIPRFSPRKILDEILGRGERKT